MLSVRTFCYAFRLVVASLLTVIFRHLKKTSAPSFSSADFQFGFGVFPFYAAKIIAECHKNENVTFTF
jgi:hypothetical protein